MCLEQWTIVIGALMSITLTIGPWMFMVHAKLAVLASQVQFLCRKLEKAANVHDQLTGLHTRHEARLEAQAVEIRQIHERLRVMSE